ncbi:TRAP transporter substrate-binding protein [Bacillus dakarensis]|uniref:TRAP transporter substrate-binding protein n=1 Tax=Robertmurraya dakarensis TaxID=1926278 RepID=UPI000981D686|nr:TRAP transporter substrate-binding protein [Bacillus dakarensis]
MKNQWNSLKKLPVFAFCMLLALLMLSACSGGGEQAASGGNDSEASEDKTFKLRMNSTVPQSVEGSPTFIGQEKFAELVKERTNGRIEIEIFYSNQLAGQAESLDALARGTIDLQYQSPIAWADKIPESNWASMPYAWKSEEHLFHLIRETELGKLYEEALVEYGVKPLHYIPVAAAGYLSTSPIAKPEDLEGLVVNSLGLANEYYKATGSGIASIPFNDYYEGLLRGTVDAVVFPYYSMETMKLSEVTKYITVPGQISPGLSMIAISQKAWDKLPSDLQNILMEVALEIEKETIPASKAFTERGIEYGREQGVEVIETTEESYQEFAEIGRQTYWKKLAEINDRTKKMIEIIEENLDYQE